MKNLLWVWLVLALAIGTYAMPNADTRWACLIGLVIVWLLTPVPRKAEAEASRTRKRMEGRDH